MTDLLEQEQWILARMAEEREAIEALHNVYGCPGTHERVSRTLAELKWRLMTVRNQVVEMEATPEA